MAAKAQEAVAVAVRVRRHDGDVPNYAAADVTSSADMAELCCDMCIHSVQLSVEQYTVLPNNVSVVLFLVYI